MKKKRKNVEYLRKMCKQEEGFKNRFPAFCLKLDDVSLFENIEKTKIFEGECKLGHIPFINVSQRVGAKENRPTAMAEVRARRRIPTWWAVVPPKCICQEVIEGKRSRRANQLSNAAESHYLEGSFQLLNCVSIGFHNCDYYYWPSVAMNALLPSGHYHHIRNSIISF